MSGADRSCTITGSQIIERRSKQLCCIDKVVSTAHNVYDEIARLKKKSTPEQMPMLCEAEIALRKFVAEVESFKC